MLGVAYPLLALQQTESPTIAGWTAFALMVPVLVLYIPGGYLVDWISSRRLMLLAEFGRWVTVSSVLGAILFDHLVLPHIIMAALFEGMLWTCYNLAEATLVPSLVRPPGMWRAMAKAEGAGHLASLTGRPLGGYLFGVGMPTPFALNAVLFGLSWALLLRRLRGHAEPLRKVKLWRETVQGIAFLRRQAFLRGAIMLVTLTNLMVNTLIMIIIVDLGNESSLTVGLVLAAGGMGGAAGAVVAFHRRPVRQMLLMHTWVWAFALNVGWVGVMLGREGQAWPYFSLALFATGFAGAMSNVAIRAVEAVKIEPEMLARVVAVSRLSSYGALCAAAPLGGLLVAWNGAAGGMAALSGTMLVLALLVTFVSRLRRQVAPPMPELLALVEPSLEGERRSLRHEATPAGP